MILKHSLPCKYNSNYIIFNDGRIFSTKRNLFLKCYTIKNHCSVKINKIDYYVHRLVYEHFGEDIPLGYDVHHIDFNPFNNHLNNLKLIAHEEHTILHHSNFKHTEETKNKMSISHKDKIFTSEHRENLSISNKGKISPKRIKILCIESNKIYESMSMAAKELEISLGNLSEHIKGKRNSVSDYHFKKITEL